MISSALPLLATCVALFVYLWTFYLCGRARGRHGIQAPAVTGHPEFERAFRVQQNTMEQLVVFLPSLYLFSFAVSPLWGGALGLVWSAARILYAVSYLRDPATRGPGFGISALITLVLLGGGTAGVVWRMLA
ncbi:MAG TPA: MAPEG family protein [Stellaceae bacterium]|nr:MAPEG family protein [Stellaceae bacterium]